MTTAVTRDLESASWGRRILALFVDWVACLAVVEGLVAGGVLAGNPNGLGTLGLFVMESALFTAVAGGRSASWPRGSEWSAATAPDGRCRSSRLCCARCLVALLVPPLLTFDGRGLHDLAARTRTVRI